MYDHRAIAKAMDLFHFEEHSPGMVFWHPMGLRVFRTIEECMRQVYQSHGFEEVRSPLALSRSLWEKSGHWGKFGNNMFVVGSWQQDNSVDGGEVESAEEEVVNLNYALKPMSCPAHIAIYKAHKRSYREIPMRLMEFGIVHRNEPSGTLSGCMRLRQFVQDDAHIFCREADLLNEIGNFLNMVKELYAAFGYEKFIIRIALRPEQRMGSDELWDRAEAVLINACQELGYAYELSHGEGSFYSPKIEVSLADRLGRYWQCGTIQVDFNFPQIFELSFVNQEGKLEQPVMLHQAVLGSIERWIGILLENQGALPLWLAPVQVAVATISEKSADEAEAMFKRLKRMGIRVELHADDATISKKIRELSERKVPLIAIVGEREAANRTVNLRRLGVSGQQEIAFAQLEEELSSLGKNLL
ncbi:MAG TPA: threonine--tRNA ligase [Cyanobacteria bacterium UBA8803]|nr:threonine--tRNA ligase [Cyanobacteria bacterium UBA9273]HBL60130.1 threonine--tRNA ligase [Cyanobacteria bacterium UBA8803]